MRDYQNTTELVEYLKKAKEANPDYDYSEILTAVLERWDTMYWEKLTDIVEQKDGFASDLLNYVNKPDNVIDFSKYDDNAFSFWDEWNKEEEKESLTEDNANNYQRLNDYVKRYYDLVKDKEEILNKYNWWEWYTPWSKIYNEYKSEIDRINNELKSMEKSEELTSLLKSIKDNWLWAKWYESENYARNWLADIINWVWSSFNSKDTNIMWQEPVNSNFKSMDKLIDNYFSNKNKQLNPEFVEKNKDNEKLSPEFRKKLNDIYNEQQKNKWWQSSIAEDTFTDTMKFGEDVKSWDYVNQRNITLAQHLKAKWLSTPEEIDAYLNKYPSWQNAKQEWKDNTIKNLTDKIWPIKKEEKPEEKKVDEIKKEIPVSSKKEDVKIWKPGGNWLPDNDSSINWIEEEKDDTLIYDKKGNPVWSKVKEIKKQDTKKQETKSNNNKWKKLNIVKWSETIKNLLKRSKK